MRFRSIVIQRFSSRCLISITGVERNLSTVVNGRCKMISKACIISEDWQLIWKKIDWMVCPCPRTLVYIGAKNIYKWNADKCIRLNDINIYLFLLMQWYGKCVCVHTVYHMRVARVAGECHVAFYVWRSCNLLFYRWLFFSPKCPIEIFYSDSTLI